MRGWQLYAPRHASCLTPRRSIGKQRRAITHSALDEAGVTCLEASDCGTGHQAKNGSVWASIIAAAAAMRLTRTRRHLKDACFGRSGRRRKIELAQEDSQPNLDRGEEVVRGRGQRRHQRLRGGSASRMELSQPVELG